MVLKKATATAKVKKILVEKVTYSLSNTNCMTINKNTGAISVSSNPKKIVLMVLQLR
ncbi:MAG: hypothetical protein L6V81_04980 [Clostridium sp.]|nr:MAG: hypothetical protein L6V81_04980 [Clostridium sp.]